MDQKRYAARVELKADTEGLVRAEFATLSEIDKDSDITLPGAFGRQTVRVQPVGHDLRALMVGKGNIFEAAGKAILEAQLNLDTQAGRDHLSALKFDLEHGDPLQEWSYTFDIIDSVEEVRDGVPVRILRALKVHSVDPVFIGAGVDTQTISAKNRKSQTFAHHMSDADAALDVAAVFVARAGDLAALKREEGRELGADHIERLKAQAVIAEHLVAALAVLTTPAPEEFDDGGALDEFLRFQQHRAEVR